VRDYLIDLSNGNARRSPRRASKVQPLSPDGRRAAVWGRMGNGEFGRLTGRPTPDPATRLQIRSYRLDAGRTSLYVVSKHLRDRRRRSIGKLDSGKMEFWTLGRVFRLG